MECMKALYMNIGTFSQISCFPDIACLFIDLFNLYLQ